MAEGDLISRKQALKELREELRECRAYGEEAGGESILLAEGIEIAINAVKRVKAADVVEVVRCRGCKYSMLWRKPSDKVIGECFIRKMNSDDEQFCMVSADDFCSYGERKDGDGNG